MQGKNGKYGKILVTGGKRMNLYINARRIISVCFLAHISTPLGRNVRYRTALEWENMLPAVAS